MRGLCVDSMFDCDRIQLPVLVCVAVATIAKQLLVDIARLGNVHVQRLHLTISPLQEVILGCKVAKTFLSFKFSQPRPKIGRGRKNSREVVFSQKN